MTTKVPNVGRISAGSLIVGRKSLSTDEPNY
jgi:hypothetical protein